MRVDMDVAVSAGQWCARPGNSELIVECMDLFEAFMSTEQGTEERGVVRMQMGKMLALRTERRMGRPYTTRESQLVSRIAELT